MYFGLIADISCSLKSRDLQNGPGSLHLPDLYLRVRVFKITLAWRRDILLLFRASGTLRVT